jgi:hypothetical protein
MSNARRNSFAPRVTLLLTLAAMLSACGATMGNMPEALGGLPASAPQRPAESMPYQNVYEVRPTREAKPLDTAAQKKLESELTTLRDAQNKRANAPPPVAAPNDKGKTVAAKKPPAKAAPEKKDAPPPMKLN